MGQHRSASASRLVGLDGFEVTAAEVVDDEWRLEVQTIAATVGCATCGSQARLHARRPVQVRDLPVGGRPVVLAWRKRIWRCTEPACAVRTWTEQRTAIRPRAVLTCRARAEACRRVGTDATRWPRSPGTWGLAGRPSCGRWPSTAPRWWKIRPAWPVSLRSGWMRPASSKPPAQHRPGTSPAWSTWRVVGCWRWSPTAPGPRWAAGSRPGHVPGWPRSPRSRWTPGAGTPAPWSPRWVTPGW